MHKRIVTILVVVVVVLAGVGLVVQVSNGSDGIGLLEQLRNIVHGN